AVIPPCIVSHVFSCSDVRVIAAGWDVSLATAVAGYVKVACPCPVSPTTVDSSLLQRGDRRRQLAGGDVEPADGEIQSVVVQVGELDDAAEVAVVRAQVVEEDQGGPGLSDHLCRGSDELGGAAWSGRRGGRDGGDEWT